MINQNTRMPAVVIWLNCQQLQYILRRQLVLKINNELLIANMFSTFFFLWLHARSLPNKRLPIHPFIVLDDTKMLSLDMS